MQNIHVFLKFFNFYWHFIQSFSSIAVLLTLILKNIELDLLIASLILVNKNIIVIKASNNKVIEVKISDKTARSKKRHLINSILAKFQLFL